VLFGIWAVESRLMTCQGLILEVAQLQVLQNWKAYASLLACSSDEELEPVSRCLCLSVKQCAQHSASGKAHSSVRSTQQQCHRRLHAATAEPWRVRQSAPHTHPWSAQPLCRRACNVSAGHTAVCVREVTPHCGDCGAGDHAQALSA